MLKRYLNCHSSLKTSQHSLTIKNSKFNEATISKSSLNFEPNQPEIDFPIDKDNRKFLSSWYRLSFRGHDESVGSLNKENFLDFVNWYSTKDKSLRNFIAIKNASDCSKTIQNEIIGLLSDQILKNIVKSINQNQFFSLIIDDTADITRIEQTDGESLFKLIKSTLTDLGLPLSNIVGQCYDGAANMSGILKGVVARIKNINNKALYVHCHAHKLNLALQDTCSNLVEVRNCIGTVNSVYSFIEASPKRHAIFEKLQMEKKKSELKLKYLSDTRWSSRYKAFKAIKENLGKLKFFVFFYF
ncbi:unnamed protein product [Brachionus calyciflorus]|uniref:DUF4371 domain-containing protein n=1 Tax=Brachionus calyciflorus TaxID=104777 RepID=A0A814Q837_9BILA|nr:unnamed protein product [Brachionus calyciflorus]